MTFEELCDYSWYADDGISGTLVVTLDDVRQHIVSLKLQFEEQLANAVNEAYNEGYQDGLLNGVCGG